MSYRDTRQLAQRARSNGEYCPGYLDVNGRWNNGFYCSRARVNSATAHAQNCCGDETYRFCCDGGPILASTAATTSSHPDTVFVPVAGRKFVSGSVLTIGVAASTVVLLSVLAAIVVYCQQRRRKDKGEACSGRRWCPSCPPFTARQRAQQQSQQTTQQRVRVVNVWTTPDDVTVTTSDGAGDVIVVSAPITSRYQNVVATVVKLTELLNRWVDRLAVKDSAAAGASLLLTPNSIGLQTPAPPETV